MGNITMFCCLMPLSNFFILKFGLLHNRRLINSETAYSEVKSQLDHAIEQKEAFQKQRKSTMAPRDILSVIIFIMCAFSSSVSWRHPWPDRGNEEGGRTDWKVALPANKAEEDNWTGKFTL